MSYQNYFKIQITIFFFLLNAFSSFAQIQDNFEGNGTITNWAADDCNINLTNPNPFQQGINTSATVLAYEDIGGQFANVRFQQNDNFNLTTDNVFTLKIYVPSSALTGSQNNQVSLKLQNGLLDAPWETQSEIIKPIALDQWQTVTFDFLNDNFINLDPSSPPPTQRSDFNRVVIQVNGENNNDFVVAYIDDVVYDGIAVVNPDPVYDLLVWSDEFDTNGAIDNSKWHHQTQIPDGGSWFNGEIQHYTDRIDNSFVSNGELNLLGKKETFTDQGVTKQYTSARLNSKFAFTYGKVEVRAQLPQGVGTWPAIWMLGKNINEDGGFWDLQGFGNTSWPACGEIDIMEHWGANQNFVQSATHTPSSFGATINHGGQTIETASSDFHIYSLEWFPDRLVFKVDGNQHYVYKPSIYNNDTWPFDADQYILFNFAFLPSIASNFTQDILKVDYIRIYQENPTSITNSAAPIAIDIKNTPNPAVDETTITYHLTSSSVVNLSVYDVSGRLVNVLINERQVAGDHEVKWDVSELEAGVYFYQLMAGGDVVSGKCFVE